MKIGNKRTLQFLLVLLIGFIAGLFLNPLLGNKLPITRSTSEINEVHERTGYQFINPLLLYDTNFQFSEAMPPKSVAERKVNELVSEGKASTISIYFRDLNNGPWFGINERESFSPASLLKVPLMIDYLKAAESNPDILKRKIKYINIYQGTPLESDPRYQPYSPELKFGEFYTVEELIENMIQYSDNNAKIVLESNLDKNHLNKSLEVLGVATNGGSNEVSLNVKNYASFFRILYNSSYLNREMSEKALRILSVNKASWGIKIGVPDNIEVASKFGVRQSGSGEKQLHDCGIVYYPDSPYLLCIMTRGDDLVELATAITEISNEVFKEVDKQIKKTR